mgnify:FL=1
MPLIIPKTLPAYDALYNENIFVMHRERALAQHIRPLEILILNLMPTKITTETQIARLLANTPLQVHMTLLQTASHAATHVSAAHLEAFYKTFDEVKNNRYDGMIITGAPVETMDFEQVDYWPELCEIMDFSETNVYSTLHVCWGAQAGLYYHYGIRKELLPAKMFGVFEHRVIRPSNPLVRGFDEIFYAPHSRWAGLDRAAIDACGGSAQGQSAMAKLNTKVSIGMKTITDKSTRNLAEMLTQGSGMGVVDCIKSQKDYPDAAPGSKRLMQKLQDFEEDNRIKLEQFL